MCDICVVYMLMGVKLNVISVHCAFNINKLNNCYFATVEMRNTKESYPKSKARLDSTRNSATMDTTNNIVVSSYCPENKEVAVRIPFTHIQ